MELALLSRRLLLATTRRGQTLRAKQYQQQQQQQLVVAAAAGTVWRRTRHRVGAPNRPHQCCWRHTAPPDTSSSTDIERVRNIGIIAHIDAGKTTTTERMLHYAGYTRSIGNVDDGDTVMDYLPAERERGITIQAAAITFGWRGNQLHLIDTPGHVDFTVEVERAMRVLDGAVAIVDAVAGVQAQTLTVWRQADRYAIPRIVFVNKMDREGASWTKCVDDIRTKLGMQPLVVQLPWSLERQNQKYPLESWIDVVAMEKIVFDIAHDNTGSTVRREPITREADAEMRATAAAAREQLVETLAELDARIVDVFLSAGVDGNHQLVPAEELRQAVRRVTVAAAACPVLLGASYRNVGVQPLLDAVVDYLPSPADRPLPAATIAGAEQTKRREDATALVGLDPNAKLVAFAFKVIVDPQRGPMVFVRVYSGTLAARATLVNGTRGGVKERALKLLRMYADEPEEIGECVSGHICVVLGLKHTRTGDTLLDARHPTLVAKGAVRQQAQRNHRSRETREAAVGLQLHGIDVPPPVFFCAVEADSPQDERALAEALASVELEDPSLRVSADEETGQTLLSGMGELHLEIVRDRLVRQMRVAASFGAMRVAYREMAGAPAAVDHEYAKEVAGKPARAAMRVAVEPVAADGEAERRADNAIEVAAPAATELLPAMGGSADPARVAELRESIRAAVAEGVGNALFRGTVLGFPVARTRIRVDCVRFFGAEVSTPAAYRACAAQAVALAFGASRPTLLEPVARVAVACPESHVGAVLGDLSGVRRGRVLQLLVPDSSGAAALGSADRIVDAEVPLSAMLGYSSVLRSLTAGCGSFTMEVTGFGAVTAQQQQQLVKESQGSY
ncbi:Ribosome-releasing factor 2, mitochondrial [Coemansia sp. RSA 1200]|nr:Ribosome-releasing factor 2, mitochondrial [Coemansia sp. RSA 1200]